MPDREVKLRISVWQSGPQITHMFHRRLVHEFLLNNTVFNFGDSGAATVSGYSKTKLGMWQKDRLV